MIFPSMWQILKKHPYLLPVLLIIMVLFALGHVVLFLQKLVGNSNCPDCRMGKTVCVVACDRVSRRLAEIDREVVR